MKLCKNYTKEIYSFLVNGTTAKNWKLELVLKKNSIREFSNAFESNKKEEGKTKDKKCRTKS